MTNEELCVQIRQGHTELYGELLRQNRGLVFMLVRRYTPFVKAQFAGADAEDLKQAARMGLFLAAMAYDPSFGCSYATAAVKLATREIWRLLGLYSRDGVTGSNRPERHGNVAALDEPLTGADGEEQDETRGDLVADPSAVLPAEYAAEHDFTVSARVEEALADLTEQEAALIRLMMLRGLPLRKAASRLGLTVAEAQKEKRRALDRLRRDHKLAAALLDGVDYDGIAYRHKGVAAFNTTWSSTVEDAVLIAERRRELNTGAASGAVFIRPRSRGRGCPGDPARIR